MTLLVAVVWAIHIGLWMAFVDNPSAAEWVIGILAAALAAAAAYASGRAGHCKFRPTFRMIAEGWRIPWYALDGTWELIVSTYRQLVKRKGADSYLAAVPFKFGSQSPRDAGRRMLAVTYTTLTPNFVVVGLIEEQNLMLYHQTLKGDVLQITQNLGAQP